MPKLWSGQFGANAALSSQGRARSSAVGSALLPRPPARPAAAGWPAPGQPDGPAPRAPEHLSSGLTAEKEGEALPPAARLESGHLG